MSEPGFKNVAIIGMGLMGASLAKALIKWCPEITVTGVVRRPDAVTEVLAAGAAHQCTTDVKKGLADADLVIHATPVQVICKQGVEIMSFLKTGCVVTDMGSTKNMITHALEKACPDGIFFIGSHPMAGSEKTGLAHAFPELYQQSLCIVTPTDSVPDDVLNRLKRFWESVGCGVRYLSPNTHDLLVSAISHLPHLVAACIVRAAATVKTDSCSALELASTGFFDTTRVATGSSEIWRDICLTNKDNIIDHLDKCAMLITELKKLLKNNDADALVSFLEHAKAERIKVLKK